MENAELKRKLGGKWVSGKFFFSLCAENDVAAVAVSNADVTVSLGDEAGAGRTLKSPRITVAVSGKNAAAAKYFRVRDGAVTLMGDANFE